MARPRPADILLVDSDPAQGREILSHLEGEDLAGEWVGDEEKAFNRLENRLFDVLIAELRMQHVSGMRLMAVAKERNPEACVLFVVEPRDIELALKAMAQGAYDFQTKPLNLPRLAAVVRRGIEHQRLALAHHELRRRLDERFGLGNLLGQSRQMVKVYNTVRQVAPTTAPVLIEGEPGTGKELIAQAIHNNSPRRDEVFAKFECAAMPLRLQEIQLLGQGSSSSVQRPWRGAVELADKGTLFLDEAWALPEAFQSKLLDILTQRHYERPGDDQRITTDVRIVAATTRPLRPMVEADAFNAALCRHLSAVVIQAPALRHRPEDIPLLVEEFARAKCRQMGQPFPGITRNALDVLDRYRWPGNVRELKNVIDGMLGTARELHLLDVTDVPAHIRRDAASEPGEIRVATGATMDEIERVAIEQTLKACGYNKEACAKTLAIGLRTLYRKLKQYDIG